MANILTGNPFVIDSPGIICNKPLVISTIIYIPAAANNVLQLNQWFEDKAPVLSLRAKTGTVTLTKTLTITDEFAAGAAGDMVRILTTTGASANLGRRQIESLTSNDAIIIVEDTWTNEASQVYDLDVFTSTLAAYLKAGASDASPVVFYPQDYLRVANLLVHTITAGTAYIYFKEGAYSSNG